MSPSDLEFLCALVRVRSGLVLTGERGYYAETRLAPVARREGHASVADLVGVVRSGSDERLLRAVVEAMLIQETAFFRDRPVFRRLVEETLPRMAEARDGRLRIWSAGCGTGQEPYSLAMAAEDDPRLAGLEILASDLSQSALEKAETGLYTHFEVQRGLPIRSLLRHFEAVDDAWRIGPRVRRRVRWRRLNLVDDFRAPDPFDVVLCRHVLDVFDPELRAAALRQLEASLAPDGLLVLSPGEGAPAGFERLDAGVHRRASLGAAAA